MKLSTAWRAHRLAYISLPCKLLDRSGLHPDAKIVAGCPHEILNRRRKWL